MSSLKPWELSMIESEKEGEYGSDEDMRLDFGEQMETRWGEPYLRVEKAVVETGDRAAWDFFVALCLAATDTTRTELVVNRGSMTASALSPPEAE